MLTNSTLSAEEPFHVRVDFGYTKPDLKQCESYERSRSHMKLRRAFGRGCRDARKAKQTVGCSVSIAPGPCQLGVP